MEADEGSGPQGQQVVVECAAAEAGRRFAVSVGGERLLSLQGGTGIQAVVLRLAARGGGGRLCEARRFNTYDRPAQQLDALAAFLRGVPVGRVLVLGVSDSAVKSQGAARFEDVERALIALGGAEARAIGPSKVPPLRCLRYREAWAFVGAAGAPAGAAAEAKARTRKDVLRLSVMVHVGRGKPDLAWQRSERLDARSMTKQLAAPSSRAGAGTATRGSSACSSASTLLDCLGFDPLRRVQTPRRLQCVPDDPVELSTQPRQDDLPGAGRDEVGSRDADATARRGAVIQPASTPQRVAPPPGKDNAAGPLSEDQFRSAMSLHEPVETPEKHSANLSTSLQTLSPATLVHGKCATTAGGHEMCGIGGDPPTLRAQHSPEATGRGHGPHHCPPPARTDCALLRACRSRELAQVSEASPAGRTERGAPSGGGSATAAPTQLDEGEAYEDPPPAPQGLARPPSDAVTARGGGAIDVDASCPALEVEARNERALLSSAIGLPCEGAAKRPRWTISSRWIGSTEGLWLRGRELHMCPLQGES